MINEGKISTHVKSWCLDKMTKEKELHNFFKRSSSREILKLSNKRKLSYVVLQKLKAPCN